MTYIKNTDNKENRLVIKKKSPKGEDGYKVFSIRIKEDLFNSINELANKSGRSRNELIRVLLEFAIDNCILDSDLNNEP